MSSETNGTKFKILIGVLSVLLIALAVYTVSLYNDSKDKVTGLEQQKVTIENELEELIANYDEIIQDNELKDKDLLSARDRIEVLLDSVKNAEANVLLIERYKSEVGRLKNERKMLFKRADSLIAVNKRISMERDSTTTVLNETIKVVDSVNEKNTSMAETIKKASIVNATNLKGEAVIIRNNGKVADTRRASRADKIRACFTLAPNAIAKSGDRELYVQVINPRNNLLGDKETTSFESGVLNYSAKTSVFYENEALDVCILVNATENNLIEGRYTVNVFDGETQVAKTTMELK